MITSWQTGPVTVYDGVFQDNEIHRMDEWFSAYTHWGLGFDKQEYGAASATLGRSLKWDQWVGLHKIIDDCQVIMRRRLIGEGVSMPLFHRAFINNFKFGDSPMFHPDGNNPKGMTYMVYPNVNWDLNWGGHTAFADDNENVIAAVNPKPGRIVAFPVNVNHCGIAPTKVHRGFGRFSIAFQSPDFTTDPNDLRPCHPDDIEKTSFVKVFGDSYYRILGDS
jgi:hypothetical protein